MTTVKVTLRASSVPLREGTLLYQVIHKRVPRQISTKYKLFPNEWDKQHTKVLLSPKAGRIRLSYLLALQGQIETDTARLKSIVARLERTGDPYTTDDVVRLYLNSYETGDVSSFAWTLIQQLKQIGKARTAERYTVIMNSFERFAGEKEILLDEIDSTLMMKYETFLKARGICPNTSSYYMRGLRAIYNLAVEKGMTLQRNPFKHVYTGIDKTVKRAVPMKTIRQIQDLNLTSFPQIDFARDIFMFSFYTRGMSFIDIAFLKKKNLQNGILSYRRHKTNQQLFIKWEAPMQKIINKYDTNKTPYMLPIIKDINTDEWQQYKNASHFVNDNLKKLGRLLGLPIPLTSYVARHAWASIAKSKNIPISTISEALGHESENTTRIYLASLDTSVVDAANRLILKSL